MNLFPVISELIDRVATVNRIHVFWLHLPTCSQCLVCDRALTPLVSRVINSHTNNFAKTLLNFLEYQIFWNINTKIHQSLQLNLRIITKNKRAKESHIKWIYHTDVQNMIKTHNCPSEVPSTSWLYENLINSQM